MTREQALERVLDPRPPTDSAELGEFEAWLERDAELRRLHHEQTALWAAMDSWEPAEPTAGFDGRLYAQIEADQARRSGFWGRLGFWKPAWAMAGLAATLALALWIGRSDVIFPAGPAEAPKVALSSEDAEYLRALEGALDDIEMLVDFEALALHEADDGRS